MNLPRGIRLNKKSVVKVVLVNAMFLNEIVPVTSASYIIGTDLINNNVRGPLEKKIAH